LVDAVSLDDDDKDDDEIVGRRRRHDFFAAHDAFPSCFVHARNADQRFKVGYIEVRYIEVHGIVSSNRLTKSASNQAKMAAYRHASIIFLTLCQLGNAAESSMGKVSSTAASTKSLVGVPSEQDIQNRIEFVKTTLSERLNYVLKGKRMSDFQCWIQEQGGEAKIFSMHGIDVNFDMDELQNMELDINIVPLAHNINAKDPFLPDRLNLSFGNNTEHSFHPPVKSSADNIVPTALQLSLRATKLSFHFAPALSTAWLALLSKKFRRAVWYKWVAHCLAQSGAAFIKWGQYVTDAALTMATLVRCIHQPHVSFSRVSGGRPRGLTCFLWRYVTL
jgi:hypothetical protein